MFACGVLGAALDGVCRPPEGPPASGAVQTLPVVQARSVAPQFAPPSLIPTPRKVHVPALSEADLDFGLQRSLESLGSWSIGKATRGRLFGGVQLESSPWWDVVEPDSAWGTVETVRAISYAIAEVNRLYPDSHVLGVGHMSRKHGGRLRPHRSHQSGRDADLGFYYTDGSRWYVNATEQNLDVPRTYALLASLLKTTEIEYVFIDRSLKPLLRAQAVKLSEPRDWVAQVFDGTDGIEKPIVRHARGHQNHLHVRFASPHAVELAQRAALRLGRVAYSNDGLLNWLLQRARNEHTAALKLGPANKLESPVQAGLRPSSWSQRKTGRPK